MSKKKRRERTQVKDVIADTPASAPEESPEDGGGLSAIAITAADSLPAPSVQFGGSPGRIAARAVLELGYPPDARGLRFLLLGDDADLTAAEARAELEADGVDVAGFLEALEEVRADNREAEPGPDLVSEARAAAEDHRIDELAEDFSAEQLEKIDVAPAYTLRCDVPPPGWQCRRPAGHEATYASRRLRGPEMLEPVQIVAEDCDCDDPSEDDVTILRRLIAELPLAAEDAANVLIRIVEGIEAGGIVIRNGDGTEETFVCPKDELAWAGSVEDRLKELRSKIEAAELRLDEYWKMLCQHHQYFIRQELSTATLEDFAARVVRLAKAEAETWAWSRAKELPTQEEVDANNAEQRDAVEHLAAWEPKK